MLNFCSPFSAWSFLLEFLGGSDKGDYNLIIEVLVSSRSVGQPLQTNYSQSMVSIEHLVLLGVKNCTLYFCVALGNNGEKRIKIIY